MVPPRARGLAGLRAVPQPDRRWPATARSRCRSRSTARSALVKWFRDSRTMTAQRPYTQLTVFIRISDRLLCGIYVVPVWALCPIFLTGVPDSDLTPLTGAGCLAWVLPRCAWLSGGLAFPARVRARGLAVPGLSPLRGVAAWSRAVAWLRRVAGLRRRARAGLSLAVRVLSNRLLFDRFREASTIEGRGLGERISHPSPIAAVTWPFPGAAGSLAGATAALRCLPLIRLVIVRGPSAPRHRRSFVASLA